MLTLKASMAVAILAGTALVSAGAGYAVSRATMTAQVSVVCPSLQAAPAVIPQSKSFPPLGVVPSTTGGQKF